MTRRDDWARIDVQMPAELLERIQRAAEARTLTVSALVRLTLDDAFTPSARRRKKAASAS